MTLSRGTTHSPVLQNGPSASATPGELPNGLLHPDIHPRMVTLTRFLNAQLHPDIHPALATPRSKRRTPETKIMRALLLPRPSRAVLHQEGASCQVWRRYVTDLRMRWRVVSALYARWRFWGLSLRDRGFPNSQMSASLSHDGMKNRDGTSTGRVKNWCPVGDMTLLRTAKGWIEEIACDRITLVMPRITRK